MISKKLLPIIFVIALLSGTLLTAVWFIYEPAYESYSAEQKQRLRNSDFKQKLRKSPLAQTPSGAGEYYANKRAPQNGAQVNPNNYVDAIQHKRQYLKSQRVFAATPWQNLGPKTVGGRTRSLVFHPETPQIIYAAGVSGGVWKSGNYGLSWEPIADDLENISVVTLAIVPNEPNIIFAGTGEGVYVGRPIVRSRGVEGNGIFRSIDDGASWQALNFTLNNPDFRFVNKIRVAQDGTLFAATIKGIWRSNDIGESWQLLLDQSDRVGGCHEVELQPGSSPNQLLVSCGSFESAAVYKSEDNGDSWQIVLAEPFQGRTTIAYAPSNPSRVYALSAQNQFGSSPYGLNGLYRSEDGGDNWLLVSSPNSANRNNRAILSTTNYVFDCSGSGQYQDGRLAGGGWYYNLIVVDPTNQDRIWTGGLDLWRSDDGGENFKLGSFWWANNNDPSFIHADHHLLVYHPNYDGVNEKRLFATNDGGIWNTSNSTDTLASNNCLPSSSQVDWRPLNNNYAVTQFYHGSVARDGKTLIGGSQDNGTQWRANDGRWEHINGGDGSYSAIDPDDPSTVYVSSQYANLVKIQIRDGQNSAVNISGDFDNPGLFITPFSLDPNNSNQLWLAGLALWRGDSDGQNWVKVSRDEYTQNYIDGLSAVAVQPNNSNLVLLGGSDGYIYRHTSALSGNSSTIMSKIKIASGFISSINFDRNNPMKVVASVSTFGQLHAWLSEDAGQSWNPIDQLGSAGLPDLPTHDIVIAPHDTNTLYAATDIGVYVSENNGVDWFPLATGMPNVPVEKLVYNRYDLTSNLFAFTYGRGAFKSEINDVTNISPEAIRTTENLSVNQNAAISYNVAVLFKDQNDDPLSYSADGLPPGISLQQNGQLEGSTSSAGLFVTTIIASDGELEAQSELAINIIPVTTSSSSGGGSLFFLVCFLLLLTTIKSLKGKVVINDISNKG